MRIVELKSQNVKILYKPTQTQLKVGDFVSFTEGELTLIAQVLKITLSPDEYNMADLYFILTNKYGKTQFWNGESVSVEAHIEKTSTSLVDNYINNENASNISCFGYTQDGNPINLSLNNLLTPALIGYEKQNDNLSILNLLVDNLQNFNKKLLIVDYKGNKEIVGAKKVIAGFQEKLPLDSTLLEKISEIMLDNVSIESKAVIEEVLFELSNYAKESPLGFIPLTQLINVIDDTYKKSKISQLILLKNKLRKYQKLNIFADNARDINSVKKAFDESNIVLYDVSNIPQEWKDEFLARIITNKSDNAQDFFLYADIEELNSNNLVNRIMFKANKYGIKPILAANYRYIAIDKILDFAHNAFLFKTNTALKKRQNLSEVVQALPDGNFLIVGKLTANILRVACFEQIQSDFVTKPFEAITNDEFVDESNIDVIEKNINNIEVLENDENVVETNLIEEKEEDSLLNIDMNTVSDALSPNQNNYAAIESAQITEQPIDNAIVPEQNTDTVAENVSILDPVIGDVIMPIEQNEQNPEILEEIPQDNIQLQEDIVEEIVEIPQEENEPVQQEDSSDDIEIVEPNFLNEEIVPLDDNMNEVNVVETDNPNINIDNVPDDVLDIIEESDLIIEDVAQDNAIIDEPIQEEIIDEVVPINEDVIASETELVLNNADDNQISNIENDFEEVNLDTEVEVENINFEELDFVDSEMVENQANNTIEDAELLDLLSDDNNLPQNNENDEVNLDDISFDDLDDVSAPKKEEKLPVYNADYSKDEKISVTNLKEGDLVKHNKYGLGTVKKITTHGNKVLCHINFEDFGRRLLDPDISQLEKIE